ncbi:hypothetical protein HOK68_00365 [Candidatus Woesearchaeota archaeon]|mgnify:CR=1 FL=1|jgi:hypothetical protein|nr:hypothetical protein [Candidatus Woesearchaeota archaeon]MBT4387941.1 hypothetical protein [Candidatus Woesearchaeota archaeon]MBT4595759.1 hypothetical protein [Candidatus Woesearchaeota archaeon]MBT5741392.1 hypothetical protein [Candidatus Woesearchaeota archaeon]MBT6505214.1 hypothetical protein [Candidatus Woesearchaeota archaeon]
MKIKWMIHRSEKPFLQEKEVYKSLNTIIKKQYPEMEFIDNGVLFSIHYKNTIIDFDYGYHDMEKRDFSEYNSVISTGMCAIFNPNLQPGTLFFAKESDFMNIDTNNKELKIKGPRVNKHNEMSLIFKKLISYESTHDTNDLKQTLYDLFGDEFVNLKQLNIHDDAKYVTANGLFKPSELGDYDIKREENNSESNVDNLKEYLEKSYDCLNCETYGLMKNPTVNNLMMFSFGLDKPYSVTELTDDIRAGKDFSKNLPTFNLGLTFYFKTLLLSSVLEDGGNNLK